MQEIHPIGGGRFFGCGGGGGDRRLRPHQHHHHNSNTTNNQNNHHQALKCPRCDSVNTKFCYYNNYNLSQPRYFCKGCRRYWTKGGVLRNVPVGGGCRKSKRSKPKNSSSEPSAAATTTTSFQPEQDQLKTTSNSHSSSESSAAPSSNNSLDNHNLPPHESNSSSFFLHPNSNPTFEPGPGETAIFSEIGNLTSLIASTTSDETMAFGYGSIPDATTSFQFTHPHGQDLKFAEMSTTTTMIDQTVAVDLSAIQSKFGPLDWQSSTTDQGLFDLTNTVDQAYWTHHTQWNQDNPTLFPLP